MRQPPRTLALTLAALFAVACANGEIASEEDPVGARIGARRPDAGPRAVVDETTSTPGSTGSAGPQPDAGSSQAPTPSVRDAGPAPGTVDASVPVDSGPASPVTTDAGAQPRPTADAGAPVTVDAGSGGACVPLYSWSTAATSRACNTCAQRRCCAQMNALFSSPQVDAYFSCIDLATSASDAAACDRRFPAAAQAAFAYFRCEDTQCFFECF